MTRRTLATHLAKATGLSARQASLVLDALPGVVAQVLAKDQSFHWRGMGTFQVRRHARRRIHNPATGATIDLAERRTVAFKPGAVLRAALKRNPARSRGAR